MDTELDMHPFGKQLIGLLNSEKKSVKNALKRFYFTIIGTPDLHSHLRYRGVKALLPPEATQILDLGCGNGLTSFEMAEIFPQAFLIGLDISDIEVERAQAIRNSFGLKNCQFMKHDLRDNLPFSNESFDLVLLIDIIEHVGDDRKVLREVSRVLKPEGFVIISVPTPNYPKFFGRKFHYEIGHVRDGYWLYNLCQLLKMNDFALESYMFHTYVPAATLCALYYRLLRLSKIGLMATPLLKVTGILADSLYPVRSEKHACSLVVRAKKWGE